MDDPWRTERERMVADQIAARQVRHEGVLQAMRDVPRHLFVPAGREADAYVDGPLPIGHGQTISQPFIVALMTALARPMPGDRALEVGTGCGYQAAVLARLVRCVYTLEVVPELGREAAARLAGLGFGNVVLRIGDGSLGWPEEAPFDIILATAAPEIVPPALIEQLCPGGRLVIPVGPMDAQRLELIEKNESGHVQTRTVAPVRFVPMVAG